MQDVGVEKNEDLGRAYLKKAADAGNEKARELYETVTKGDKGE